MSVLFYLTESPFLPIKPIAQTSWRCQMCYRVIKGNGYLHALKRGPQGRNAPWRVYAQKKHFEAKTPAFQQGFSLLVEFSF